ncbi:hypothetical protein CEXT_529721 [Caerostris extrusa]|uniref:Uncharacterized protein n=1 Tax=Caerostris extrusa TaxID=172846 RepID=A0AAV4MCX2_CAEEX|nr:hypothetical protein CEXT_529721 [Caerostris extrusa]
MQDQPDEVLSFYHFDVVFSYQRFCFSWRRGWHKVLDHWTIERFRREALCLSLYGKQRDDETPYAIDGHREHDPSVLYLSETGSSEISPARPSSAAGSGLMVHKRCHPGHRQGLENVVKCCRNGPTWMTIHWMCLYHLKAGTPPYAQRLASVKCPFISTSLHCASNAESILADMHDDEEPQQSPDLIFVRKNIRGGKNYER